MNTLLNRARIVQNAYIVNDLEAACQRWHKVYGIGPFVGHAHFSLHMDYRDTKVTVELSGVFVQSGDLCIELLQQHSPGPSPFRDVHPEGHEGFHHVAIFCQDYQAERDAFAAAGYRIAGEFDYMPGCRICYVDTVAALGHMIELYTDHEVLRGAYRFARDAAENWDGTNLIRMNGLG